jgi:hypothetical protein
MSAMGAKAELARSSGYVCFVPILLQKSVETGLEA